MPSLFARVTPEEKNLRKVLWFTFSLKRGRGHSIRIPLKAEQHARLQNPVAQEKLRSGSVSVEISRRRVTWGGFYPFGLTPPKRGSNSPTRIGIASEIHGALTIYLTRRFPTYVFRHTGPFKPARRRQLREIGIKRNKEYNAREYRELVLAHVNKKCSQRHAYLKPIKSFGDLSIGLRVAIL